MELNKTFSLDLGVRECYDNESRLLTRWEVVLPTTPEENSGGISIDSEDPMDDEESRRARLLPRSR